MVQARRIKQDEQPADTTPPPAPEPTEPGTAEPGAAEQPVRAELTEVERAAAKRAAAIAATGQQPPSGTMLDALVLERRGYVQRGLDDRVRQVDEQIRLHGGTPPAGN